MSSEELTIEEQIEKEKQERTGFLGAGHRELTAVPPELLELTHLTKLYLQSNSLTSLPSEIAAFSQLTVLFLGQNALVALPPAIGDLKLLVRLRLEHNKLVTLPDSIGNLTALSELHIENNELQALPRTLGALTKLREFHATNNRLRTLPNGIGGLSGLSTMMGKFQVSAGNALDLMPSDVVAGGDKAILDHLNIEYLAESEPPFTPSAEPDEDAQKEAEELKASVIALRGQHDTVHEAIALLSAEMSHDLAMRDALTVKIRESEEKQRPAEKIAQLRTQRDELDTKVNAATPILSDLLKQRNDIASEMAPKEALYIHRASHYKSRNR